jgi:hypothetical protein
MKLKHLPVVFVSMVLAACGAGGLGETCSTAGTTDGCADGLVCTNSNATAVCQQLCTSDADCSASQNCNGITGTSLKSCQ